MVQRLFSGLKFFLFLVLIPLIYATSLGFAGEVLRLDPIQIQCFLWGIVGYILFHLFIAEPSGIYQYGKSLVADIFKFFAPLVAVAPLILPIFSILLLIVLFFAPFIIKDADFSIYFLFLASFCFAMHMTFAARELREQDTETLKAQYFFSIALVYLASLLIFALMLDLSISKFSFVNFVKTTFYQSQDIYVAIFKQLFVPR